MNDKIIIKDRQDTIAIGFEDIEKYHGQAAIAMVAITFKALLAALAALAPDEPPRRDDISITSGHPGPGVRDTFEMVTRAVTRNAYTVDTTRLQARWSPHTEASYGWDIKLASANKHVEINLKDGVLPARFFELQDRARRKVATADDEQELVALKRKIVDQVLPKNASELFDIRQGGI